MGSLDTSGKKVYNLGMIRRRALLMELALIEDELGIERSVQRKADRKEGKPDESQREDH